jgi:hypothetical protein
MDIKKMLEKGHSKAQVIAIVSYIGSNKNRFKALVYLYLKGPYLITQRASWPLSIAAEKDPSLILPHLKHLVKFLHHPGVHDAAKRNTMRLLQFVVIPKRLQGKVADICFEYLADKKQAIAIRVFSMSVLSEITVGHPDLQKELRILIEDELPYAKPAFVSRAKRVLKKLD